MDLQENGMSDENKGGSDLDIFEGLGKKTPTSEPGASGPPAPPSASTRAAVDVKSTLLGMPSPVAGSGAPSAPPKGAASAPPAPPSIRPTAERLSAPPSKRPEAVPSSSALPKIAPPPSRGSLPAVSATPSTAPAASPPVTSPAPLGAKVDMDWDDDDEATHVFDKDKHEDVDVSEVDTSEADPHGEETVVAPREDVGPKSGKAKTLESALAPAASAPPPPPPSIRTSAAPPNGLGIAGNTTMRSATSAPPPPPPPSATPPPPPVSAASGAPPAPPATQPFGMSAPPPPPGSVGAVRASAPVPSVPPPPPGQTTTAPMPMPGPRPASAPPPPSMRAQAAANPSVPPAPRVPSAAPGAPTGGVTAPMMQPLGAVPSAPPPAQAVPSAPPRPSMEATQMVPRRDPSRFGPAVGAAMAILGILAALAVYVLMPRSGRLVVNVVDTKNQPVNRMEIFVDGKKQCETAPCIVDQLPAGQHVIKVLAAGYEAPAPKEIGVESRRDTTVDFTLAPAGRVGTGFKVAGNQPGVKLFVDGKEIGSLPQELRDLAPGEHRVRIAEAAEPRNDAGRFPTLDRYKGEERTLKVVRDEMQDLGTVQLKVVRGKAVIQLGTPGAKVYVVSGADRREPPKLPISIDVDTSRSWAIEATKPGFVDYRETISFDDGQAEKTYNVVLEQRGAAPAPAPVAPAPQPAGGAQTQPTAKPPAPAAAAGEAFLNINSLPASTVVLDGAPLGPTPRLKVSVKPGSHTILFINSEQSLKKSITVTVANGETKAAFAKLRD